jgi:hypothetical protein
VIGAAGVALARHTLGNFDRLMQWKLLPNLKNSFLGKTLCLIVKFIAPTLNFIVITRINTVHINCC